MLDEMLTLNNGSSEAKAFVFWTMLSIRDLCNERLDGACIVAELVDLCHNEKHCMAERDMTRLKDLQLVESDGRVQPSVKNIVLSAAEGSGANLTIGSPIKPRAGIPSPEELGAIIDGVLGIQMGVMSAVDHQGVTVEELGTFVRSTPGGKKGSELWREFTSRRDKPGAKENYGFADFIREVIAERAS